MGRRHSWRYDFVRQDQSPLWIQTLDGAGALVTGETSDHDHGMFKDSKALRASVTEARRRCTAGDPAEALVRGRGMHWASAGDPVREAYANELLVMAYQALGRPALAEIAEIHHHHRDLPQVDILGGPSL